MLNYKETLDRQLETYISIVDMVFLWRLAALSTEDREKSDGSLFTWKDYSSKLFNMIRMRHPRIKLLLLVNDAYHLDVCIKDSEHDLFVCLFNLFNVGVRIYKVYNIK